MLSGGATKVCPYVAVFGFPNGSICIMPSQNEIVSMVCADTGDVTSTVNARMDRTLMHNLESCVHAHDIPDFTPRHMKFGHIVVRGSAKDRLMCYDGIRPDGSVRRALWRWKDLKRQVGD